MSFYSAPIPKRFLSTSSSSMSASSSGGVAPPSSRAPIHNPYDKFPEPEFDDWINGIKSTLKEALGFQEEVPAPESSRPPELDSFTRWDNETREDNSQYSDTRESEEEESQYTESCSPMPRDARYDYQDIHGQGTVEEPIDLASDSGSEDELESAAVASELDAGSDFGSSDEGGELLYDAEEDEGFLRHSANDKEEPEVLEEENDSLDGSEYDSAEDPVRLEHAEQRNHHSSESPEVIEVLSDSDEEEAAYSPQSARNSSLHYEQGFDEISGQVGDGQNGPDSGGESDESAAEAHSSPVLHGEYAEEFVELPFEDNDIPIAAWARDRVELLNHYDSPQFFTEEQYTTGDLSTQNTILSEDLRQDANYFLTPGVVTPLESQDPSFHESPLDDVDLDEAMPTSIPEGPSEHVEAMGSSPTPYVSDDNLVSHLEEESQAQQRFLTDDISLHDIHESSSQIDVDPALSQDPVHDDLLRQDDVEKIPVKALTSAPPTLDLDPRELSTETLNRPSDTHSADVSPHLASPHADVPLSSTHKTPISVVLDLPNISAVSEEFPPDLAANDVDKSMESLFEEDGVVLEDHNVAQSRDGDTFDELASDGSSELQLNYPASPSADDSSLMIVESTQQDAIDDVVELQASTQTPALELPLELPQSPPPTWSPRQQVKYDVETIESQEIAVATVAGVVIEAETDESQQDPIPHSTVLSNETESDTQGSPSLGQTLEIFNPPLPVGSVEPQVTGDVDMEILESYDATAVTNVEALPEVVIEQSHQDFVEDSADTIIDTLPKALEADVSAELLSSEAVQRETQVETSLQETMFGSLEPLQTDIFEDVQPPSLSPTASLQTLPSVSTAPPHVSRDSPVPMHQSPPAEPMSLSPPSPMPDSVLEQSTSSNVIAFLPGRHASGAGVLAEPYPYSLSTPRLPGEAEYQAQEGEEDEYQAQEEEESQGEESFSSQESKLDAVSGTSSTEASMEAEPTTPISLMPTDQPSAQAASSQQSYIETEDLFEDDFALDFLENFEPRKYESLPSDTVLPGPDLAPATSATPQLFSQTTSNVEAPSRNGILSDRESKHSTLGPSVTPPASEAADRELTGSALQPPDAQVHDELLTSAAVEGPSDDLPPVATDYGAEMLETSEIPLPVYEAISEAVDDQEMASPLERSDDLDGELVDDFLSQVRSNGNDHSLDDEAVADFLPESIVEERTSSTSMLTHQKDILDSESPRPHQTRLRRQEVEQLSTQTLNDSGSVQLEQSSGNARLVDRTVDASQAAESDGFSDFLPSPRSQPAEVEQDRLIAEFLDVDGEAVTSAVQPTKPHAQVEDTGDEARTEQLPQKPVQTSPPRASTPRHPHTLANQRPPTSKGKSTLRRSSNGKFTFSDLASPLKRKKHNKSRIPLKRINGADDLKSTAILNNAKGKERAREPSESPSDASSSGVSTADKMLRPSSSRSSSVVSHTEVPFLPPPPKPPLLHHHSSRPPPRYTDQPERLAPDTRPPLQNDLPKRSHTDIPAAEPKPEMAPNRSLPSTPQTGASRKARVTRSNCRYHRISIPRDQDGGGPRVSFLVPGCSLVDRKLMDEEEIEDHGDATAEDAERMQEDIESHCSAYTVSIIRQLVGMELLREADVVVYYVPSPGEAAPVTPATHWRGLSRLSRAGDSVSPTKSSRAPLSQASTASRVFSEKRSSDVGETSTEEEESENENDDRSKRARLSPAPTGDTSGSAAPVSSPPTISVRRRVPGKDTLYQPPAKEETSDDDKSPRRKSKSKKNVILKRPRTSAIEEDAENGRQQKRHKPRSSITAIPAS